MKKGNVFLPILNYHALTDGGFSPDGIYTLSKEVFQRQLDILARNRMQSVSLEEVWQWLPGKRDLPERAVVLTFDDGWISDFSVAVPLLRQYGFRAAFFVNPGTLDTEGYLTTDALKEMGRSGMEIGSHGFDHLFLTTLADADLAVQVETSKIELEILLGKEIHFFSIPRGRYDERVLKAIRDAGYRLACSSDVGLNRQDTDPFRLRRWALKRSTREDDFISIVEGRPKKHLFAEYFFKDAAYRLLGHTAYEWVRNRLLKESMT